MTLIAVALLAVLLPVTFHDLLRRPTIRRLGLRNVSRRRGEAALVVGGSMLATALITASFVIGDSFGASIRDQAQDQWGPIDEVVVADSGDASGSVTTADLVASRINKAGSPDIDGVLPIVVAEVAVGDADDSIVVPAARLVELDLDLVKQFGNDPASTGLDRMPGELPPGEVIVNRDLADDLGIDEGGAVEVYAQGTAHRFLVAHIVRSTGLAGFADIIAAPGTVSPALADAGSDITAAVLVSNTGDVYDGADRTDAVVGQLSAVTGPGVDIEPIKQQLLEEAKEETAATTELFGTIGGFSVAAGVLLVINLFVMLAGERKTEMGTMRAVGVRRATILRAFALEGAVYGVLAAALGAAVGVGVGTVVIWFAESILDTGGEVDIRLDLVPLSLLSGAVIGFAISQATVVATSLRTTRLNIVRALRDLPEPTGSGRSWKALVASVCGIAAAIAGFVLAGTTPVVAMAAPVVGAVSAVPLLARLIGTRPAVVVCSAAGLAWSAAVFGLLPETMADPDVSLFLVQGVLLVGLAVAIFGALDQPWLSIANRVTGGGLGARLGLAHPLARPVRSALLVSMYALVIFTITFMAVMNSVFQGQIPTFATQAGGGYELLVDSNQASPLPTDQLTGRPDVVAAVPVIVSEADVGVPDGPLDQRWAVSLIDSSFVAAEPPTLLSRADGFDSDREAWSTVTDGQGSVWIVVPDYSEFRAGDRVQLGAEGRAAFVATVAGTTELNWSIGSGLYLPASIAPELFGTAPTAHRHYLDLVDGTDVEAVAASINVEGVRSGADAASFLSISRAEVEEQEAFLRILQGYLGLGLLIGLAGLSVVLVRAVRERRRQLGMLRAIGVGQGQVRRAFLVEASFIGLQGVLIGIGLGLLSSWQVLTRSSAFEEGLTFAAPLAPLVAFAALALAASVAAALAPAARAGRVPPAAALRIG